MNKIGAITAKLELSQTYRNQIVGVPAALVKVLAPDRQQMLSDRMNFEFVRSFKKKNNY